MLFVLDEKSSNGFFAATFIPLRDLEFILKNVYIFHIPSKRSNIIENKITI